MTKAQILILIVPIMYFVTGCEMFDYQAKYKQAMEKVEQLNSELAKLEDQINTLKNSSNYSNDDMDLLLDKNRSLEKQVDSLNAENEAMILERENTGFNREIKSLRSMIYSQRYE